MGGLSTGFKIVAGVAAGVAVGYIIGPILWSATAWVTIASTVLLGIVGGFVIWTSTRSDSVDVLRDRASPVDRGGRITSGLSVRMADPVPPLDVDTVLPLSPEQRAQLDLKQQQEQRQQHLRLQPGYKREDEPSVDHLLAELAPARAAETRKFIARNRRPRDRGSILWNPPQDMRVGHTERIEVRIGDADVAIERLYDDLSGRGVALTDSLEIAPLMRVIVTADRADFSIRALSTADQLVRPEVVVRWDFDVTPRRGGVRKLRLLASMRIKVEGKEEIVDLPSYESEVRVAVAPIRAVGQFCGKNWKWIAVTVVIPVAVWIGTETGLTTAIPDEIRAWLHLR